MAIHNPLGIVGYRMADFRDGYSQFEFAVIVPFLDTRSNFSDKDVVP